MSPLRASCSITDVAIASPDSADGSPVRRCSVTPPASTTSAAPSWSAGMMSVSGRLSSSTRRVVLSARISSRGAIITTAVTPSVAALVIATSAPATLPGQVARMTSDAPRTRIMPSISATPASAADSSVSAPSRSRREPPTARATMTSLLRVAVRATCSAQSVVRPTASVNSTAPRRMPASCSSASCCSCGQTTPRPPQSARSAGVSASDSVSAGAARVPPSIASAGSVPARVSAAVSATSVPVPACQRSARTAALR